MNPPAGAWKPKAGNGGVSTSFPDDRTPAQVDNAVSGAFKNSTRVSGNKWRLVRLGSPARPLSMYPPGEAESGGCLDRIL